MPRRTPPRPEGADSSGPLEPARSSETERGAEVGRLVRQGLKSALARWVLIKRRGGGRVWSPTPQDEATHRGARDPSFAEDYTFAAVQPGMGLVVRVEWLSARDAHRVWVVQLRPDGVWTLPPDRRWQRTSGRDPWRAGDVQLDCRTPHERWTLRFDGSLEHHRTPGEPAGLRVVDGGDRRATARFELSFTGTAAPFVPGQDDDPELLALSLGQQHWDASLLRAARHPAVRGYVQPGRVRGSFVVDGVAAPVQAAGLRQHFWGARDEAVGGEVDQYAWVTDDERQGWIHRTRRAPLTLDGGFVVHRGRATPVSHVAIDAGTEPAPVVLRLGDVDGVRRLDARRVSGLTLDRGERGHVELGLLRIEGPTSTGWGLWAGARPR